MDRYINELKRTKAALEKADNATTISDGVFGFFCMLNSGLSEKEQQHVLGLSDNTFEFARIERHHRDLYPRGSLERQSFSTRFKG